MKQNKIKEPNELHLWFFSLWFKRAKNGFIKCFECSKYLHESGMLQLGRYSHILPKSQYEELEFEEDNVVIVCEDCHTLYTNFCEKAKKQFAKSKELKKKYNIHE